MLKPAISRNRNLRFPVAGRPKNQSVAKYQIGCGVARRIDCGLAASSDFGKFYFMSLHRNVAWPVKSSPELVSPEVYTREHHGGCVAGV